MAESLVEPRAGVAPPPEASAAPEGGTDLPDDLLKVPAVQGLMAGQPGAFSAILSQFEKVPEAKIIAQNKDALMKAGVGFYRSLDGTKGAVFNQLFVSPDDLKAADAAGQLDAVAPPFEQVNAGIAKAGAANPVLAEGERPADFKTGSAAAPPAPIGATPKPPAASAQKSTATARAKNLMPTPPAGGPKPASGLFVNTLLKPVI